MADFMQVVTTVDSEEAAEQLARGITGARVSACVQIVGPGHLKVSKGHQSGKLGRKAD